MKQKIKILILEELLSEIRLIERELELSDFHYESLVLNAGVDFKKSLVQFAPDVVLAAYSLPDIQIVEVLDFTREQLGDVPVIMLSGELSEDMAIEFLKTGIDDYILKPNFKRLPQSIESAIKRRQIIAEREEAKASLERSEENLRQMIKGMPFPVAMFDKELRYQVMSDAWHKGMGLSEEEIIGRNHYDIDPTISDEWRDVHKRCMKGESLSKEEDVFIRPNGKKSWIRWKVQPWRDFSGEIGGIIVFVESIREKKEAEEKLRKSEETFRQLAEHVDEVFWLTDWKTRELLYISKAYERVYGKSCESLYTNSTSWSENIHPDDRERVVKQYQELAETGNYDVEYRIVVDGKTKWIKDKAFPIMDTENEIYRMAGLSREIAKN